MLDKNQKLIHNKCMLFIYSRFKLRKWKRYTPEKRHEILQALENKLAKEQKRDPMPVIIHENPNWHCFGMFSAVGNNKTLYIHEDLILDQSKRFHALETIIHEGRHGMQYAKVFGKPLKWYEFKAKRWRDNWKGYFSSIEDSTMYNNQEIERDAQSYTIKKLQKLSRKYKNEKDFRTTLQSNINRFEYSEQQAYKKYGPLARWRINRKVRKKARRSK